MFEYQGSTYGTAERAKRNYEALAAKCGVGFHKAVVVQQTEGHNAGRFYVLCFQFENVQDGINMAMTGRGVYCIN